MIRYPRRSVPKDFFYFLGIIAIGHTAGKFCQLEEHSKYLRDIEYPDGYKRAMENVKKNNGLPDHRGIILRRAYQISSDNASPKPTSEHGMIASPGLYIYILKGLLLTFPPNLFPSLDSSSTERPQSKWDQIRMANSRTAQNSAWAALRQQHEKIHVRPKPQDRDDDKRTTSDG